MFFFGLQVKRYDFFKGPHLLHTNVNAGKIRPIYAGIVTLNFHVFYKRAFYTNGLGEQQILWRWKIHFKDGKIFHCRLLLSTR
jgi:hypothetical protein